MAEIEAVEFPFHRAMDEQKLIARSKKGDVEAFNLLVEQYQRMAYNLALRMLGDSEGAADACQDAFLSAYKAIGKFRGGSFKSWILRITANSCHNKQRAARRSRTVSLDDMLLGPDDLPDNSGDIESPEGYALRQELGRLINEGLGYLPADQRLVVILSDIQGLSYEEVSKVAGCSLGTVKSRLNRGRTRMRDFLMQNEELLPRKFRLK
jgi:RNA polymerase sigma-70 factor (ECF subfamily)